jgi:insulin-like growth factor 1 receptor
MLDRLGAGNFGTVDKAMLDEQAAGSRSTPAYTVAVKQLKADPSDTELAEFMSEAAIMAVFKHRNILSLIGVCTRGQPALMVLPYCEVCCVPVNACVVFLVP